MIMNLVFIYGPPASGKLTVAQELAKLTNYKIFHNHSTIDLIDSVIPFGSKNFLDLNSKFRILLFETAAKEKINIIFTFCYSNPHDNNFIKKCIRSVERYNGKLHFVQLYCKEEELYKRVKNKSRKKFNKFKDFSGLKIALEKWNMFSKIPFVKSLSINNTNMPPQKVAQIIKKHYKLKKDKNPDFSAKKEYLFHIG